MPLAKFKQYTGEIKRYSIDYSQWLDPGETISDVSYEIQDNTLTTPLAVSGAIVSDDNVSATFYISGGEDTETYELVVTMSTTGGQVRQDEIIFTVEAL